MRKSNYKYGRNYGLILTMRDVKILQLFLHNLQASQILTMRDVKVIRF